MTTHIPIATKADVRRRARDRCEYCLIAQSCVTLTHQVDHVIAEKHGGVTSLENLALSCAVCNRRKSSDVASFDPASGQLTPLFNPRTDAWLEHFQMDGSRIEGISAKGRTTSEFLQLNAWERVTEREELSAAGLCHWP